VYNKTEVVDYYLRSRLSLAYLQDFCAYFYYAQANCVVTDGINQISPYDTSHTYIDHNNLLVARFKYRRYFETTWSILNAGSAGWSESDGMSSEPSFYGIGKGGYDGSTYYSYKKQINLIFNSIVEEINLRKNPYYLYATSANPSDTSYFLKKLARFADSSSVYITNYYKDGSGGSTYQNGSFLIIQPSPNNNNSIVPLTEEQQDLLVKNINNPNSEGPYFPYAILTLKLQYTTEELSKIQNFEVKPGESLRLVQKDEKQDLYSKMNYVINVNGTKILVADKDFENTMSWHDAKTACEKLGNGWRLPNNEELKAIYEQLYLKSIGDLYINQDGTQPSDYWSIEENTPNDEYEAYYFCFANGLLGNTAHANGRDKTEQYNVRAVRTLQ
jgi:hypothetical protein